MAGGMSMDPSDLSSMSELRAEIDRIDGALVHLLTRRAACIDRAVVLKVEAGLPARIEDRIEEVVANVRAAALADGLDPDLVEVLWRRLIDWSVAREERVLGAGAVT